MMNLTFTFAGMPNAAEIRAALLAQAEALEGKGATVTATTGEDPVKVTKKATKKTKAAPVVEEEDETDELETSGDEDETEESDDEIDLGDEEETEEEEAPKKATSKIKLEDVILAFQRFAKRNSRDAAKKVLAKFAVKSVQDLPVTEYAKVMKILA